ncbi:LCP family protein required for cell wall assembly [Agromyces hippuratus]|uniref:LCP family protein required for cell wall assembly n=1 Tax=Agromyces hippuratus TaxID=286438 RepID=A0A852WVF1_9MICO|nr:LCP family protein [Agromyces hippuratus]NYG22036.1 LCP family protein required for cell wall assembly [Agromyces hippuratus]
MSETGDQQAAAEQAVAAEQTAVPRHGRLPRRSAASTYLTLAASIVAVLAVSAASVAAYAAIDLVGSVKPGVSLANADMLDGVPDIGAMDGGLNFLLVGSDKRPLDGSFGDPEEDSGVLNDVNMLLHISQDHSHVEVVSFPRDMIVPVPECPDPIDPESGPLSAMSGVPLNSVLGHGGLGCVSLTIEQLTGTKIPVGGVVEFKGVAALSEAVGGVEVCLVDPIDDPESGLHLAAGTQSISGYDALAFLRTRKAVGDGSDLGRIASQQAFLASLARTVQSDGTLNDPVKLYSIAKAVLSNMELSKELQNPATLISIAKALQDTDLSKIAFIQYPTAEAGDGQHVVPTDSAEAINLALQEDRPVALDPTANDNVEFGTVANPTAPAPEPDPAGATDAPATSPPAETLPDDVTGLTGDEVRCTTANAG